MATNDAGRWRLAALIGVASGVIGIFADACLALFYAISLRSGNFNNPLGPLNDGLNIASAAAMIPFAVALWRPLARAGRTADRVLLGAGVSAMVVIAFFGAGLLLGLVSDAVQATATTLAFLVIGMWMAIVSGRARHEGTLGRGPTRLGVVAGVTLPVAAVGLGILLLLPSSPTAIAMLAFVGGIGALAYVAIPVWTIWSAMVLARTRGIRDGTRQKVVEKRIAGSGLP